MKKLTNLILGLTLTATSLFSQSDSLSVNSNDYGESERSLYPDDYVTIYCDTLGDSLSFMLRPCDVNGDFKADFWRMYGNPPPKELLDSLSKFSSTDYFENKVPDAYIFDLNKNGIWWDDKLLLNIKRDDLFYNKPKETISLRKEIKL